MSRTPSRMGRGDTLIRTAVGNRQPEARSILPLQVGRRWRRARAGRRPRLHPVCRTSLPPRPLRSGNRSTTHKRPSTPTRILGIILTPCPAQTRRRVCSPWRRVQVQMCQRRALHRRPSLLPRRRYILETRRHVYAKWQHRDLVWPRRSGLPVWRQVPVLHLPRKRILKRRIRHMNTRHQPTRLRLLLRTPGAHMGRASETCQYGRAIGKLARPIGMRV
jgi:hypothetical protein